MAGMEYTFSADVAPFVAAMGAAIEAAKRFESAVDGAKHAEEELGAAGGGAAAGLAAQTAAMEAAALASNRMDRQHSALRTGLRDTERLAGDAGRGIGDLTRAAEAAGSGLSGLGGQLSPYAMPAAIGALVAAAAAVAPALVSAGLGFGAFTALAWPALTKVRTGLTAVTTAQKAYTKAQALQAQDPTAAHLAAQQRALANLKATWAQMPAPVAATVRAIQGFGRTWSQIGRRSGIQAAALTDLQKVMKIGRDLAPSITTLAKAAAPAISRLLSGIDKGIKSSGFTRFIHSMASEIGPATRALQNLGGTALSSLGRALEILKPVSAPFIRSISHLIGAFTPGAASLMGTAAKGLTAIGNAVAGHAGDIQGVARAMGKLATLQFKNLAGIGSMFKGLGTALAPLVSAMDKMHQLTSGGGFLATLVRGAFKRAYENMVPGLAQASQAAALNTAMKSGGHPIPVPIKPVISGGDLSGALKLHKAVPMSVKPVVDGAGKGAAIPVKGKVTLSGLGAGIKSQIANLKIPDTKVKVSIQVTGAGAAKAAMASVVGAARKAAAGATAALNSLGAAGAAAGRALDQGLAGGILAGESSVVSAAAAVAGAAAAAARKAAGIASPSKVWHGIGKNMIAGLILGLQGGKAEVQAAWRAITGAAAPFKDAGITATIKKLREDVRKAFKAGDIGKHQRDSLVDYIDHGNQRLMKLAQQRAKIMGQIKAATALAKSVTQGAIASADITGIAAGVLAGQNKGTQGMTIQQGQQDQLTKIKQFTHAIKQLKREGLDKTSIKQLLAAGVSGGLPAAQRLLGEGPKAVKESARLQREIIKASRQLGVTGANAAYESAAQMGKGLAAGLRAQLKPIVAAMRDIARALIATLRKELGLKPGQGLGGLLGGSGGGGGGGGAGGGGGGHHRHPHPGPPHMRMLPGGGHLIHPGGPPMIMHPGGMGGGATAIHIHTHTTVTLDGAKVASSVQTHTLRRARRNISAGLKPANRAA
jgi:hypothetical protein